MIMLRRSVFLQQRSKPKTPRTINWNFILIPVTCTYYQINHNQNLSVMTNLIFPLITAYEIFVTVIIMLSACVAVSIFGVVAYFTWVALFTRTNHEESEKVVHKLNLSKGCPDLTKIDNLN